MGKSVALVDYGDFLAQDEQSTTSMLGTILKQLVSRVGIPDHVREAFQKAEKEFGGRGLLLSDSVDCWKSPVISPSWSIFRCTLSYLVACLLLVSFVTHYQAKKEDYYTWLYSGTEGAGVSPKMIGRQSEVDSWIAKTRRPEFRSYGTFTEWTSGRQRKLLEPSLCPGDRSWVRRKDLVFSI